MQANKEIRITAQKMNVKFWQIADAMGIHEVTFVKRLRHELKDCDREHILKIIQKISTNNN